MDKRSLSERDICTKFISPALRNAGWNEMLQIREELHASHHEKNSSAKNQEDGMS